MEPLYSEIEFSSAKASTLLPCRCQICNSKFFKQKRAINKVIRNVYGHSGIFCSKQCISKSRLKSKEASCSECSFAFVKKASEVKRSSNHFCSRSCAVTYNNKHKTHGTRRSKLELWLEAQLTALYPNLEIHFNQNDAIGSELDIYFPSLKLAFELNGIFHYEPIFGESKLNQITSNDISKTKACLDAKIDLCVIDTSGQKYFKPKTSQKYLDIITSIVSDRLAS